MHKPGIEPDAGDMKLAQAKIDALMFPCTPLTDAEKEAVAEAVWLQAVHTLSMNAEVPVLPEDVESFAIGHFQMKYRKTGRTSGICPAARALLLREGLLYKGVERKRQPEPRNPPVPVREIPRPLPGGPYPIDRQQDRPRDSWKARPVRPKGNPPPEGIPPQGEPPLPGLPRLRRGKQKP